MTKQLTDKKYRFTLRQNSEDVVSSFETDSEQTAIEFYSWAKKLYKICVDRTTFNMLSAYALMEKIGL